MTATTEAAPDTAPDAASEAAQEDARPTASGTAGKLRGGPLGPYLPGRREALFLVGGAVLGATIGTAGAALSQGSAAIAPERDDATALTGRAGKDRLEAGNARFAAATPLHPDQTVLRRNTVAKGQHPFAAVLACADSRVAPETLFDQGLGDLYVARSAGQVIDKAVLGTLEYGVANLGVSLLVVLGHSACGAVKATIDALDGADPNGNEMDDLVAGIAPAVEQAKKVGAQGDTLLDVSIQINVERAVEQLKHAAVIGDAAEMRAIKVVGAVYDLATGRVDWL
jgi:carbonic anhydrase